MRQNFVKQQESYQITSIINWLTVVKKRKHKWWTFEKNRNTDMNTTVHYFTHDTYVECKTTPSRQLTYTDKSYQEYAQTW